MPEWPTGKLTEAAKAIFAPPLEVAEGWDIEDYADDLAPVEVWPENHEIVELFESLTTQWLAVGGMGFIRYGLRYESLYPQLDRISATKEAWNENFQMVRAMEVAALSVMNKKSG